MKIISLSKIIIVTALIRSFRQTVISLIFLPFASLMRKNFTELKKSLKLNYFLKLFSSLSTVIFHLKKEQALLPGRICCPSSATAERLSVAPRNRRLSTGRTVENLVQASPNNYVAMCAKEKVTDNNGAG